MKLLLLPLLVSFLKNLSHSRPLLSLFTIALSTYFPLLGRSFPIFRTLARRVGLVGLVGHLVGRACWSFLPSNVSAQITPQRLCPIWFSGCQLLPFYFITVLCILVIPRLVHSAL